MRLGDGPKARLRFDLHTAQERCARASAAPATGKLMGSQRSRVAATTAPGATPGGDPNAPNRTHRPDRAALMARPSDGEVTERPWKDGKTITFGARLYAYGRRHGWSSAPTRRAGTARARRSSSSRSCSRWSAAHGCPPRRRRRSSRRVRRAPMATSCSASSPARSSTTRSTAVSTRTPSKTSSGASAICAAELGPLELLEIDVARVDVCATTSPGARRSSAGRPSVASR